MSTSSMEPAWSGSKMVDHQVIQRAVCQQIIEVFESWRQLDQSTVEEHGFSSRSRYALGDAPGNGIGVFKQGEAMVVGADPI